MAFYKRKNLHIFPWLYGAIILALFVYIAVFTDFTNIFKGYPDKHYQKFYEGWLDEDDNPVNLYKISKNPGDSMVIHQNLPSDIQPGEALNICSHNLFFDVYIDGEEYYSNSPKENLTGYGTGDVYHSISLTAADTGKKVEFYIYLEYAKANSGRILDIVISSNSTFNYLTFREKGLGFTFSWLIIFLGFVILIFNFALQKENTYGYDLFSLGVSVILIGAWTLIESNILQMIIGMTDALRVLDYSLLLLMIYPFVRFINSIAKKKNHLYPELAFYMMTVAISVILFCRIVFHVDLHSVMTIYMIAYAFTIGMVGFILIQNHIYCRKRKIEAGLKYFYIGAAFLLIGSMTDLLSYTILGKETSNNGDFLRLGLLIFIFAMFIQIIIWLIKERATTRRESFVNSMMQYAISGESAETTLSQLIEYMGRELKPEHVYIYERWDDGCYHNTFYWRYDTGIRPEDSLTPISDLDIVEGYIFEQFKKSGSVIIPDKEQIKNEAPKLYKMLGMLNVSRMILVPIRIGDNYIGFLGMMEPPADNMQDVASIMQIVEFFISEMIRRRRNEKKLINYSYYDQLTGVKNRRAQEEFENTEFDPSKPYGYIMCDINGLKTVNDNEGHEEGDRLIKDVADSLAAVYGNSNVYRMGGDEFSAYAVMDSEEEFNKSIESVKEEIKKRGRSSSLGYVFRPNGDMDYDSVKKQADRMMYEDKRRYYSAGRHNRRDRSD